ncbi:hypothetical protein EVAR_39963_1 [Eumeta japonica]|uniref:Uncharacterized protein n=1 Tax=Eumeta variegata TaxID=151549 RepID=A0A4C1X4S5_EUMVA|nr:hypothetical protein EVAR_39963_1 [Eumeta japonica]
MRAKRASRERTESARSRERAAETRANAAAADGGGPAAAVAAGRASVGGNDRWITDHTSASASTSAKRDNQAIAPWHTLTFITPTTLPSPQDANALYYPSNSLAQPGVNRLSPAISVSAGRPTWRGSRSRGSILTGQYASGVNRLRSATFIFQINDDVAGSAPDNPREGQMYFSRNSATRFHGAGARLVCKRQQRLAKVNRQSCRLLIQRTELLALHVDPAAVGADNCSLHERGGTSEISGLIRLISP